MEKVVRGHFAVGFRWVESREENGGRSAWPLCSGLPLGREEGEEPRMDTNGH